MKKLLLVMMVLLFVSPAAAFGFGYNEKITAEQQALVDAATMKTVQITTWYTKFVPIEGGKIGTSDYSFGTGFLIKDGLIATSAHVVPGDEREITVRFPRKDIYGNTVLSTSIKAEVVRQNIFSDIAILKPVYVPAQNKEYFELAECSFPQVNEGIFSVGNPGGLPMFSYTFGTATSEPFPIGFPTEDGQVVETNTFQANMMTKPGNSGGPVINYHGQVVGVVHAYYPDSLTGAIAPVSDLKALLNMSASITGYVTSTGR